MSSRRVAIRARNPDTGEIRYFSPRWDRGKDGPVFCSSPTGDPGSWEDLELVYLDESNGVVTQPAPPSTEPLPPPVTGPPIDIPPPTDFGIWTTFNDASSRRARLSRDELDRFLPNQPGPFTWPAPWRGQGVRLTTERDGRVGPAGMAYHPLINAHGAHDYMLVMLSIEDRLTLYSVDKRTLKVERLGALPYQHTGENCYWSFTNAHLFYLMVGSRLLSYNVVEAHEETVFDAGADIWQPHSSASGAVHSFRVNGGAAMFRNGEIKTYSPEGRSFDECQVTKCGRYLVSWEDGHNRVIVLRTGKEYWIRKGEGAVGHHDCGHGLLIGEDGQTSGMPAGAFRRWWLTDTDAQDGEVIYRDHDWGVERDGITRYVSYGSARQNWNDDVVLYAVADRSDSPRVNEFTAGKVTGGGPIVVVCPNLVDLDANAQMADAKYWNKPRPSVDPHGQWFVWTANAGRDRLDAFMGRMPRW